MKRLPIILVVMFAALLHAQQYVITEIRATGSTKITEQDIVKASGLQVSKSPVSLDRVKEAGVQLLNSGVFKEIEFRHTSSGEGMKVEFMVKDAETFVPADFENIVWFDEKTFLAGLHERVPLFHGELPLNGTLADDVAAALSKMLEARGTRAHISATAVEPREGLVKGMRFTADDVEVKVGQVNLSGASAAFLPELETVAKGLLGIHYQRSTLDNFITHNLTDLYLKRGYLRANFGTPVVQVSSQPGSDTEVSVGIPVNEGRPYRFAGLQWSGNQKVSTDILDNFIHATPGVLLDGVQFAKDLIHVRTRYSQQGYMHMVLNLTPSYEDVKGTVNYQIEVNEGELFTMGKLEINGLVPVSEEKARTRWRLREGEPFDGDYVVNFFALFKLPPGVAYVVEQSEGEQKNSVDVTLIFCAANVKCRASGPNQLFIPDEEVKHEDCRR